MVTITRHFFIYIFQMEHFSAAKFYLGYEKNMGFLVISKSLKVGKNWKDRTGLLWYLKHILSTKHESYRICTKTAKHVLPFACWFVHIKITWTNICIFENHGAAWWYCLPRYPLLQSPIMTISLFTLCSHEIGTRNCKKHVLILMSKHVNHVSPYYLYNHGKTPSLYPCLK